MMPTARCVWCGSCMAPVVPGCGCADSAARPRCLLHTAVDLTGAGQQVITAVSCMTRWP
jgi:hypothetical protein